MATLSPNLLPVLGLNPSGDLGPFTIYRTERRGIVWFPRTRPEKPASYLQRRHRNHWRNCAMTWSASPTSTRDAWNDLARLAHLSISGYNLFISYQLSKDASTIQTLQTNTGITVL